MVAVSWTGNSGTFLVKIQVEALDRGHLLTDVTKVLADMGANIISGKVSAGDDRVALCQFTFEIAAPSYLSRILSELRKVDGVFDVYRITDNKLSANPRFRQL